MKEIKLKLSHFITKIIVLVALSSLFFVSTISIIFQYNHFESDRLFIKNEFLKSKKELMKREVMSIHNLINQKEMALTNSIKQKLKERVNQAYSVAMSIYDENKYSKNKDEIELLIARTLNNLNYENDRTYFFINSNKGQAILFNKKIRLDAYDDIWNLRDENNNLVIQEQAKIALENKEGFLTTSFVKTDTTNNKQYLKISYVKLFEPYNLHIGMGEYVEEIKKLTQNEILDLIASIRFNKDDYLFVNTIDGHALVFDGRRTEPAIIHPNKKLIDQQIEAIKNPEGEFIYYKFKKINSSKEYDKIAYVKKYNEYDWIIGCGVYLDEINNELNKVEDIFKKSIYEQLIFMVIMFLLMSIALYLTSKRISKFINLNIIYLIASFDKASRENEKIDTQNLTYKEFISLANKLNVTLESKNETEKKLQDYIQIINENIIISTTDKDGYIVDVSEAFCKISGYTKEELIGKTHKLVRHPNTPDKFYEKMWENLLNAKSWKGEIHNRNKDGKDYWTYAIIKPLFKNNEFIGFTALRTNITDKKHIEQLSITDELTNLYNRRFFNIKIEEEINRAKRENHYFSFLVMDIDYFKQYNDTYGHQQGDIALEKVASVLKKRTSRGSDFAFRLGGEEFGIITTLNKEKVIEFANLIKDEIENLKIEHKSSEVSKFITISIGIVSKEKEEITNSNLLYKEADDCLYEAKKLGRNSIFIL
jgi:diguanylate cyclase (GGDEF)-like protein/PAS domain S-box-containing protein